jgi:hypothetical protein
MTSVYALLWLLVRARRIVVGGRGWRLISRRIRVRIHTRPGIGAMRHRSRGVGVRRRRTRRERSTGHRALWIQQMIVARPQPKGDQRARIGNRLRLPAVIGLIAPHGLFTGLIPGSGCFAAQVVLADQRFLDLVSPLGINFLLSSRGRLPLAVFPRGSVLRLAVVCRGVRFYRRSRRWIRFRTRLGRCHGRGRRGPLRERALRSTQGTDQRQSAARTHPSPHFRAMLPFQRQPSDLRNRRSTFFYSSQNTCTMTPRKKQNPTGAGIVIILH